MMCRMLSPDKIIVAGDQNTISKRNVQLGEGGGGGDRKNMRLSGLLMKNSPIASPG